MSKEYIALAHGQTLTFTGADRARRGDKILMDGKSYRVSMVLSYSTVAIRRTFWQWVKDTFARLVRW